MPVEHWTFSSEGMWRTDGANPVAPRDLLVYGNYIPGPKTTGSSGVLTQVGDVTSTAPNQIIENLDIYGWVRIRHNNVTLRNCTIRGRVSTAPDFQIKVYTGGFGSTPLDPPARIVDCTIFSPPGVGPYESGNAGQGITVIWERCNIYKCTDGLGLMRNTNYVFGCWIHDLNWYADDPAHTDGSHSDGIQLHGGGGDNYILGNLIEMGYKGTSCVIMTQTSLGPFTGIGYGSARIEKNWFRSVYPTQADACATAVNISEHQNDPKVAMPEFYLINNKFSPLNTWRVNHHALISHRTYDEATSLGRIYGNVVEGTSTPAKISRAFLP